MTPKMASVLGKRAALSEDSGPYYRAKRQELAELTKTTKGQLRRLKRQLARDDVKNLNVELLESAFLAVRGGLEMAERALVDSHSGPPAA